MFVEPKVLTVKRLPCVCVRVSQGLRVRESLVVPRMVCRVTEEQVSHLCVCACVVESQSDGRECLSVVPRVKKEGVLDSFFCHRRHY